MQNQDNKNVKKSFKQLFPNSKEQPYQIFSDSESEDKDSQTLSTMCSNSLSNTQLKSQLIPSPSLGKQTIIKAFDLTYSLPTINFREKQTSQISSFIQDALKQKIKCRCLLLTGMPGVGKTSLAKKLLKNVLGIKTIFMNANVSHSEFMMQFSYQLMGAKLRLPQLITYLEKRKAYEKAFVLLDEFDVLFTNAPVEFLEIFRIFCEPIEGVSLIATSNSMEMMINLSQKYTLSLPAYKNIVFTPYKVQQIKNIILERTSEVKKNHNFEIQFQELALKYISTKIHNFKGGDVRFVLQQMRLILSKTLETNKQSNKCTIIFEQACVILAKLNKSQQITDIMKGLPFQQCLALIAVYKLFQNNQYLEVNIDQIIKQIKQIQSLLNITKQIFDIKDILMYLEVYQFVGVRYKKRMLLVTLRVCADHIKSAFEDNVLFGKYFWKQ